MGDGENPYVHQIDNAVTDGTRFVLALLAVAWEIRQLRKRLEEGPPCGQHNYSRSS